jgi:hypothetical protein
MQVSLNHIPQARVDELLSSAATTIGMVDDRSVRSTEIRRILARWTIVRAHTAAVELQLAELTTETASLAALTTSPA